MERTVIEANESLGLWRCSPEHDSERFHQTIHRLPGDGKLETVVAHLSNIPEGDGEWHEVADVISWFGEPYSATLDEAIAEGDRLIRAWKAGG